MKHGIIKVGIIKPTSRPHAKRPSWHHPAFGLAVLLTALPAATVHAQTVSTTQTPSEQAQPADSFVDSIGMNPSYWIAPPTYSAIKTKLVDLGVRHLRFTPPDVATAQDLAKNGMTCLFKADLTDYGGNGYSGDIATINGSHPLIYNGQTLNAPSILQRIKDENTPLQAIEGIEGPNEPDKFWTKFNPYNGSLSYTKGNDTEGYQQDYFYNPSDPHSPFVLAGTSKAATYFMQDLFAVLQGDPATQKLPIIGLACGGTYDPGAGGTTSPNPYANPWGPDSLFPYVTYGNMHPYPGHNWTSYTDWVNGVQPAEAYDSIHNYLNNGNQPSISIDNDDSNQSIAKNLYNPPLQTGYYANLFLNNIFVNPVSPINSASDISHVGGYGAYNFFIDQPAYTDNNNNKLPMYATETGYQSGTAIGEISYAVQAKYIPRLLAENFRTNVQTYALPTHAQASTIAQPPPGTGTGIVRTYLFAFADDSQDGDYGLLKSNDDPTGPLAPKPAYYALQSLIGLLKEPGKTNFPTGTLNYRIDVSPTTGPDESGNTINYDRTWYVHHLLLQKSSGDYYLVLWHEISDDDTTAWDNDQANPKTTPFTELHPPDMPTTVTLPSSIGSVTEFAYDPNGSWNLLPTKLTISNNQVKVNVPDQIIVLQLSPPEAAFNGPHTISPAGTTTVQAEDYDVGGYGTAYTAYDQPGASYSAYRPDDLVGIAGTSKTGSPGYYVGWMAQGQFLNYTVNVPESGNYLLAFRYASGDTSTGDNFNVLNQGTGQYTSNFPVSYTGQNGSYPWDTWAITAPIEMALNYGQQTLRLNENTGGYNLDYMTFTRDMNSYPFSVPGGFPIASSGTSTVKTSDFDLGGQDVAYNNTYNDPGNYSAYRPNDQVGLWPCLDTGGGYEVAWTAPGQWLKYTVNVAAAGTYAVTFRVASASGTNSVAGSFHLQDANSNNLTGSVTFNGTGGWDNWASTAPVNVTFKTAGTQTVTLYEDSANFNVNSMTFSAGDTGTAFSSGGATSSTALNLGGGIQLAAATSNPISAQTAFDGSVSTYFASVAGGGYVGQDAGKAVPVVQITFAPRSGYEARMVGGVFEGSNTSTTSGYTTLATVSATPKDGMVNVVKVAGGKTYRYLRFRSSASGYCNVAEIKFQN